MKSKMIGRLASTLVLTGLVIGSVRVAQAAVVLYSDDFNSYSAGQTLADAGWSGTAASQIQFSEAPLFPLNESGFDAVGRYADGRTSSTSSSATYDLGSYQNTGVWTLEADLKFTGPGSSFLGLKDSDPDSHTSQPGLGPLEHGFKNHTFVAGDTGTTGVFSNWLYANGGKGEILPGFWYDANASGARVTLTMDYDNLEITGTATYLTSDLNQAAGYTQTQGPLPMFDFLGDQATLYGFDQIYLFNDANTGTLQFDNVVVHEGNPYPVVPEPSTLVLLSLGLVGMLGFSRKERC